MSVLTGETPTYSQAIVEEAKEFAVSIDTEAPQTALLVSVGSQVEAQHKPYAVVAFFHFKATGSLECCHTYHAAYDSDKFTVDFETDYESGDLTIIIECTGDG